MFTKICKYRLIIECRTPNIIVAIVIVHVFAASVRDNAHLCATCHTIIITIEDALVGICATCISAHWRIIPWTSADWCFMAIPDTKNGDHDQHQQKSCCTPKTHDELFCRKICFFSDIFEIQCCILH